MRLKRPVRELGGPFGFLVRQIGALHKDLLSFQERTERNFERFDGRFSKAESRFDRLETKIRDLREDMPRIVPTSVREALREHTRRNRET